MLYHHAKESYKFNLLNIKLNAKWHTKIVLHLTNESRFPKSKREVKYTVFINVFADKLIFVQVAVAQRLVKN